MHEVITLQFGQQANYVGTHYWNTQESYFAYAGQEESPVDHDVSFRAGIGADGHDTYTPRALIYDLKGAFGTLRRDNALYESQQQHSNQAGEWRGPTINLQLPPIAPSSYQQALDQGLEPPQLTTETVRYWSDYNHLFYHPKSIVQLNEYELNSSLMPFERWSSGEELFSNLDREHDLLDRDLRPFLEDCDQLQGLQILTGIDDAWGGFATKYLERVSDELGKGCRWVFGLQDGQRSSRERQSLRTANSAQSVYGMSATASVHLPMTSLPVPLPSYLGIDAASRWHTSALQAASMESATLPTRLRNIENGRAVFGELETVLNNEGNRRIAALDMSVDGSAHLTESIQTNGHHDTRMLNGDAGGTLGEDEDEEDGTNTTPKLDIDFFRDMGSTTGSDGRVLGRRPHTFGRVEIRRGRWEDEDCNTDANMETRSRFTDGPRTSLHQSQLLFPVLSSDPHIFHFPGRPEKLSIKAVVSTSTIVADRIRSLENVSRSMINVEEREALCDGLMTMAEDYEEGWDDDESYDDD